MNEGKDRLLIPPCQCEAVRVLFGQIPPLEAFHDEGDQDGRGDRIDPEVVAVPVGLHDGFGVPDAQIGTETGGGFVLGAVHPHPAAPVLPEGEGHPAALGAAQVAAGETTIHPPVVEQVLGVEFSRDLIRPRVGAQLVVVHGERLVFLLVHEGDQPRTALAVHLERLGIDLPDDLPEFGPRLPDLLPVGGAVGIFPPRKLRQDDYGPDVLAHHDGPQPRPPGLFRPE